MKNSKQTPSFWQETTLKKTHHLHLQLISSTWYVDLHIFVFRLFICIWFYNLGWKTLCLRPLFQTNIWLYMEEKFPFLPKTAIYKSHQGSAIPRGLLSNADAFPVKVNAMFSWNVNAQIQPHYCATGGQKADVCLSAGNKLWAQADFFGKILMIVPSENALIVGGVLSKEQSVTQWRLQHVDMTVIPMLGC